MRRYGIAASLALWAASCSMDRELGAKHDEVVCAAISAIREEAHLELNQVTSTEETRAGHRVTTLSAPYTYYSKVRVRVDSAPGKGAAAPDLEINVSTGATIFTRHNDWEERLHELVALKLKGNRHGPETRPTAKPAAGAAQPAEAGPGGASEHKPAE